jgi:hypothetical protein
VSEDELVGACPVKWDSGVGSEPSTSGVCKFATVKSKSLNTRYVTSVCRVATIENAINKPFAESASRVVFTPPPHQIPPSTIVRMAVSVSACWRVRKAKRFTSVEGVDVPFLSLGSEEGFVSGDGGLEPEFNLVPVVLHEDCSFVRSKDSIKVLCKLLSGKACD